MEFSRVHLTRILHQWSTDPLLTAPPWPQGSYRHRHELWIVMEYCGGGSMNDLLVASNSPMPEQAIAYVCGEALKVRGQAAYVCGEALNLPEQAITYVCGEALKVPEQAIANVRGEALKVPAQAIVYVCGEALMVLDQAIAYVCGEALMGQAAGQSAPQATVVPLKVFISKAHTSETGFEKAGLVPSSLGLSHRDC